MQKPEFVAWPGLLAGVMATFVGIGLARFAYTPLIPVLIQNQWFSAADAVYLGASNLLGYLLGALSAHRLTRAFGAPLVVGVSLAAVVLSFWWCATPSDFYWFFAWRLISGIAGALLMVVVPSLVLSTTPPEHRAMVGTLVFSGVGLGALVAATVIPLMMTRELAITWWLLGILGVLGSLLCVVGIRRLPKVATDTLSNNKLTMSGGNSGTRSFLTLSVVLVVMAYALDGIGFVPHTVFWVDFLARENNLGQAAGSLQWALFGLGAAVGPFLMGLLVRRVGWHHALWLAFCVKALAVLLPVLTLAWLAQVVSSLVVGALSPGIVAIVSGRLAQLVQPGAHQRVWGLATASFALAQACGGLMMAALFANTGGATPLFVMGSVVLWVGMLLVLASRRHVNARLADSP